MERLAGRRLPRTNAGKYRYRRQAQLNTTLSPAEVDKSREVDALLAEADSLQRRAATCAATTMRRTPDLCCLDLCCLDLCS
jgi:hypothetical protein